MTDIWPSKSLASAGWLAPDIDWKATYALRKDGADAVRDARMESKHDHLNSLQDSE